MLKVYRHGEILFVETKSIPKMVESKTNIIAKGSHGNDHTFQGGKLFMLEELKDYTLGYLKAKNTKLYHTEHSPNGCGLPDGNYEIRKQQEYTVDGLTPVID